MKDICEFHVNDLGEINLIILDMENIKTVSNYEDFGLKDFEISRWLTPEDIESIRARVIRAIERQELDPTYLDVAFTVMVNATAILMAKESLTEHEGGDG